ncbi:MAG: site-2 protease family protein [Victivallaceae bacterium]|nr:site-2 protease family protein [Victivallaceae bacterium]
MMEYLLIAGTVLFVLIFFGMCVFVHELGHFMAAKLCGLRILAFSLGFKKAWGKKINGVEYRIGWIPAGGYVELPQLDTTDETTDEDGRVIPPAGPWARLFTAFCGPFFNILFGLLLGCAIWIWGMPQGTPDLKTVVVDRIVVDSPEYRAGLRPGDEIVRLNGEALNIPWTHITKRILFSGGEVTLDVKRGGETLKIVYQPEPNPYVAAELRRERLGMPFFTPRVPLLVSPMSGSPAERAGLRAGDLLRRANDGEVDDILELNFIIAAIEPEQPLYLDVEHRDGSAETLTVIPESTGEKPYYSLGLSCGDDGRVDYVVGYSPADAAGVMDGDRIVKADGVPFSSSGEFFDRIASGTGAAVALTLERDGNEFEQSVVPVGLGVRRIGADSRIVCYPSPFRQLSDVVEMTWETFRNLGINVGHKLNLTERQTTVSAKNLSGPLGIVVTMYRAVSASFMTGVYMVVFISFALAIFNLLPLPVLDGGHILFAVIEIVTRRKVPKFIVKNLSYLFVVILIGGMAAVTMLDVMRFVPAPPPVKAPVFVSIEHPDLPNAVPDAAASEIDGAAVDIEGGVENEQP